MKIKRLPKGLTLIELIISMVIMSIAALAITSLIAGVYNSRKFKIDSGVNTELAQECAELMLSVSRDNYANVSTTNCNNIIENGYGPPVISGLTSGNSSTGSSANWSATDWAVCPYSSGTNCTLLKISNGQGNIPLMLVSH
jgi:prepilin-type N-terminal cleavage/methylation domain-containing protein